MQQQGSELILTKQEATDLGLEGSTFGIGQAAFLFGRASMANHSVVEHMAEVQQDPLRSNNISELAQKAERLARLTGQLGELSGLQLSIADQTTVDAFKTDLYKL